MKEETRLRGTVLYSNGKYLHKEDSFDMELHEAMKYLILKYVTKGHKLMAVPAFLTIEVGQEEERIQKEREL
jgi:hypothetical protein